jgi:Zn-dependent protease
VIFGDPANLLPRLVFFVPALLLGFVLHEMAHAYVAVSQGDQTPRIDGRLSPDPRRHIDPVGLILILIVGFGYARPVSINPSRMRGQYSRLLVALAGPATNLALALVASVFIKLLGFGAVATTTGGMFFQPPPCSLTSTPAAVLATELLYIYTLNLFLMIFNLIPIPPLDGFELIRTPLRRTNPRLLYNIEMNQQGIFFAFILVAFLVPSFIPIFPGFLTLVSFLLTPLTTLLGVPLSFPC